MESLKKLFRARGLAGASNPQDLRDDPNEARPQASETALRVDGLVVGGSVGESIVVRSEPEDQPRFARIYTAPLPRACRLKVKLYTSAFNTRYDISEITQANGRWVLFDVHRPADKILDRELLPDVERLCAAILRIDAAFVASRPSQFADNMGKVWRRV